MNRKLPLRTIGMGFAHNFVINFKPDLGSGYGNELLTFLCHFNKCTLGLPRLNGKTALCE